jgi:hypothetical protein
MRDALERILFQCNRHIFEGKSFINTRYIHRIAHEGLGIIHDEPNSRTIVSQETAKAVQPDEVKIP